MSLEPGRLCEVSSKGRKSFDALHAKAALDWGLGRCALIRRRALLAG
jgi:hypothetical protein